MPSVGPTLPPAHAAKQKLEVDEKKDEEPSTLRETGSPSPSSSGKRMRTIGPTLPPVLVKAASTSPRSSETENSGEDDEFGPALPSQQAQQDSWLSSAQNGSTTGPQAPTLSPTKPKTERDEWMIVPPTSSDWSSRMDPTKLKSRKFNTGRGSRGPVQTSSKDDNASWTETPEEKRTRLQREVMSPNTIPSTKKPPEDAAKVKESAMKLREYSEKCRGPSLYKKHQKTNIQEKEDDPSARAFDREKDIAGGLKINHAQRREMMTKAADFGSKFSSGSFL